MAGPLKVFSVGYSASASFSSSFSFPDGVQRAFLEVPSFSTAAELKVYGSTDGSTYRLLMQDVPQTATVQIQTFSIASAAANRFVPLPICAPYIRFEPSAPVSASTTFKVVCHY